RQAVAQVSEPHPDQQWGGDARYDKRDAPQPAPTCGVAPAAELYSHTPQNERDEQKHERRIERGESGGVPAGEGREHGGAGGDEPDFVAVPHGRDRVQDFASAGIVAADDTVQSANAEVESFE